MEKPNFLSTLDSASIRQMVKSSPVVKGKSKEKILTPVDENHKSDAINQLYDMWKSMSDAEKKAQNK
jgi:hypothetical protein